MPKGVPLSPEHRARISAANTRPAATEKRCSRCHVVKPSSDYGRRKANRKWLRSVCLACERASVNEYHRQHPEGVRRRNMIGGIRRYGIQVDDFDRMNDNQGGVCAICRRPPTWENRRRLSIDHCHTTGTVRGLLCDGCNQGIGRFNDDPNLLREAIAYLERFRSQS